MASSGSKRTGPGPTLRTRNSTPAPTPPPSSPSDITTKVEAVSYLTKTGYITGDDPLNQLQLAVLISQATHLIPKTAKQAIATFQSLAVIAEAISVELLAMQLADTVAAHLEPHMDQLREAAIGMNEVAQETLRAGTEARKAADGMERLSTGLSDTTEKMEAVVERLERSMDGAKETAKAAADMMTAMSSNRPTPVATHHSQRPQASQSPATYAATAAAHPPTPKHRAEIARGDARDCRFIVNGAATENLGADLTATQLVDKANATVAMLEEMGMRGPVGMTFVSAFRMRTGGITYHLNNADGARWLAQPAVRSKFVEHYEGAVSAISALLHCVVEFVPVSFDPQCEDDILEVEERSGLATKTIRFAKWFKTITRRREGQRSAFLLVGFLTREAANTAIAEGLQIAGRWCAVRKLLPEPRRCMKCQRWEPGHLAAQCPSQVEVCGRCGDNHRTRSCTLKEEEARCANCVSRGRVEDCNHEAGERHCPAYTTRWMEMVNRSPGARYRFFPTQDPQTWELADWVEADNRPSLQGHGRGAPGGSRGLGRLAGGAWGEGAALPSQRVPLQPIPTPKEATATAPKRAGTSTSRAFGTGIPRTNTQERGGSWRRRGNPSTQAMMPDFFQRSQPAKQHDAPTDPGRMEVERREMSWAQWMDGDGDGAEEAEQEGRVAAAGEDEVLDFLRGVKEGMVGGGGAGLGSQTQGAARASRDE